MAAQTSATGPPLGRWALAVLCVATFCGHARSGADDSSKEGWRIEEAHVRFNYYDQRGFGYQSQAGPGPAGSEELRVYEPMFYLRVRQNPRVQHTVTIPIDVITSASTDSVDAITTASRHNEAGTVQINDDVAVTDDDEVNVVWGVHAEEWFYSAFAGIGYTRDLAQDNATVSLRIDGSFDWFRPYGPWPGGFFPFGNRFDFRGSFGGSIEASQILGPTTLVKGGYGIMWSKGALLTPWNSVPTLCNPDLTECLARVQERFPGTRLRQNFSGLLAQHIPGSQSTLRFSYRFYFDDFDVRAHTMLAELYQYMTERAYLKLHYRAHHQNAVFFWTTNLTVFELDRTSPRTSDSDLARFWAHEWGIKLLFYITPPGRNRQHYLDAYYNRYTRTNDLTVNVASIGYGYNF